MILNKIHIILFLFLISGNSFSQNSGYKDFAVHEVERQNYLRNSPYINSDYQSDTNINIKYYKLDLKITYQPDYLTGIVSIQFTGKVNSLQEVFFDLSNNLTVDSVVISNTNLSFTHVMDKIHIALTSPMNTGATETAVIYYKGVPIPTGFGSFIFGTHDNETAPAIWTLSEPFGSSDWFPCKNSPADKADSSDVIVTCSNTLTAVSNGNLISETDNGDGTKTYSWHNSYNIAVYVISLAIADYAQYNSFYRYSPTDSMPVFNYIYPENLDGLKSQLDKTDDMLEFFSEVYGQYPFINEKYGHAEFGRIAGMEHQTISSMGLFNDNIMAHELAHQWFGDKITCRNWENIWLNEGFATYGEALYNEYIYGQPGYDEFIRYRMSDARDAVGSIYVMDVNDIYQIFNGDRSYAKGSIVLHMLRGVVGDQNFFNILKAYSADTNVAYKTAITEDFKRVAETVSGNDLTYFFNEWIYGENYPRYNVDWTTEEIGSNQFNATINILQTQNTVPQFFTMPIQIRIDLQNRDTILTVFNNSQYQSFTFTFDSRPLNFKIDPDNYILKEVRGEDIIPVSFSLGQNYPNPFNPSTTISYELGRPSNINMVIYDVTGRQILTLLNNLFQREGFYKYEFNFANLSSGVYFYYFTAADSQNNNSYFEDTKKMILIK